MKKVAVVAHRRKSLGGGLDELRELLAHEGVEPLWYEVNKSKQAPAKARRAVKEGADLVLVWGGDGMVQRTVDALAGKGVEVGILPAGTANLLATNLGIPRDLAVALQVALHGARRKLDLGVLNGEHFAVMAGTGFDALMIRDADSGLKDRLGRVAYVWTGARHLTEDLVKVRIELDGKPWFSGQASCVLLGNVGTVTGGLVAFPNASPEDGALEVGVVMAKGPVQWSRVMARMITGKPQKSKLVRAAAGTKVDIRLGRKLPYELDGGARKEVKRLRASIEPAAITLAVPSIDTGTTS
jgi:YegS/Rv2252/BmrU family lipid kinase